MLLRADPEFFNEIRHQRTSNQRYWNGRLIGELLAAQLADVESRATAYRMGNAKFLVMKTLAEFELATSPVNAAAVRDLLLARDQVTARSRSRLRVARDVREAQRMTVEQAAVVPELLRLECRSLVVQGRLPDAVLDAAAARQIDMIVVGSGHGKDLQGLGRTVRGLIRAATCPVLVVNRSVVGPYGGVTVPVDLSDVSARALRSAVSLGLADHARVTVVHAFEALGKPKLSGFGIPREQINGYVESRRSLSAEETDAFLEAHGPSAGDWQRGLRRDARKRSSPAWLRVRPPNSSSWAPMPAAGSGGPFRGATPKPSSPPVVRTCWWSRRLGPAHAADRDDQESPHPSGPSVRPCGLLRCERQRSAAAIERASGRQEPKLREPSGGALGWRYGKALIVEEGSMRTIVARVMAIAVMLLVLAVARLLEQLGTVPLIEGCLVAATAATAVVALAR